MKLVYGQCYLIPSTHMTYEEVTPWSDGTFTVKPDAFWDLDVDHATIEEIESSGREGDLLADLIRRRLTTDKHDACDYPWVPSPSRDTVYRGGVCPTCGEW